MENINKMVTVPTQNISLAGMEEIYTTKQQSESEAYLALDMPQLESKFNAARTALLSLQKEDGHWCFPLEADCTIPAEYILMMHFMNEIDVNLEKN